MASRPDEARQLTGLGATDDRELNPLLVAAQEAGDPSLVVIG